MASGQPTSDSIFDVLYADTRRLSSLLSQFSDDGIVTELTRAAGETASSEIALSIKVVKSDTTEGSTTSSSRKIDPQWLLPLLFLEEARGMIQRDITSASIGSLVLSTGRLIVTDLSILQEMWKSPAMKRHLLKIATKGSDDAGNRHERRASGKPPVKQDTTELEAVLELLPLLPHSPQLNIVTSDYAVWSTIDPGSLVGSVADLLLKHGAKVAGSWSMVGILDGRPFEASDEEGHDYDDILSYLDKIRLGMTLDNVWKAATELATPIRQALGRPITSYGVTPLIIFREIEQ